METLTNVIQETVHDNKIAIDIPLNDIYSDEEFNSRGKIRPGDVIDLTRSIEEIGLKSPILVQPYALHKGKKWRIIAGYRRFASFRVMKRESIPCFIEEGLTDVEARKINLIENLKRKDLNIMQEAKAVKFFRDNGWTQQMCADELNMSLGWIQVRCELLDLPEPIQKVAAAGLITQNQIKEISRMKPEDQFKAVKLIKEKKERNESVPRLIKPKVNPLKKRKRDPGEIFDFIETISQAIGYSFTTRCLGWSAGEVNDFTIHHELKEEAEKMGKLYLIPKEIAG